MQVSAMKSAWILLLSAVAARAQSNDEHINDLVGWYMPGENGQLEWIDEREAESRIPVLTKQKKLGEILKLVKYYLLAHRKTTEDSSTEETTQIADVSSARNM